MNYNELMAEVGKSVGLDDFGPDEDGLCELYGEEATVSFQYVPEAEMVLTTGLVCKIENDATIDFYRTFLEANFMFQRTRGATLSIDPSTDAVMLARYDRLEEMTPERFLSLVEAFVTSLTEWKKWQAEGRAAAPGNAEVEGGFVRV